MAIKFIPFFYTLIFAAILVAVVPKAEIRRFQFSELFLGQYLMLYLLVLLTLPDHLGILIMSLLD